MDLEIGRLCEYVTCGVRDYLPFQCDLCKKYFCLEHFKNHDCLGRNKIKTRNKTKKQKIKRNKIKKYICSVKNCQEKSFTMLKCFQCENHYCLKHRYRDLHQCQTNIKK